MKTRCLFLLGLFATVLAEPCLARNTDAAYCELQARSITQQIVQSVLPNLDEGQRARVQAAADTACLRLLAKDPGIQAQSGNGKSTDWFTNYILHGKPPDKPGNKRLEHLK